MMMYFNRGAGMASKELKELLMLYQGVPKVSVQEVAAFDLLKNRLRNLYDEVSNLSKKSPDSPVNKFKLGLINEKLIEINGLLGHEFKPFKDFSTFDIDVLPTNSDVVVILSQYLDALETWRSGHIVPAQLPKWQWNTDDGTQIDADGPTRYSRAANP